MTITLPGPTEATPGPELAPRVTERTMLDALHARYWREQLARVESEPAPKKGGRRLSPRFVEWLMGCPEGWITDVPGVTRTEALRMLGNGVVEQQATAALRHLLTVADTLGAA